MQATPALAALLACLTGAVTVASPGAAQPTTDAETLAERERAVNTLLSLAIPGTGQLRDGKDRGWAYLALEAAGWAAWAERRHRGGELRTRYRDLAWEAGRIQSGPRMDGDFPYYETLASWERSGAYDADAGAGGIQPEEDVTTYNGSIWSLARGLFLPPGGADEESEAYARALEYYRNRAYGEAFLWDWSGSPGAQARLGDLIEESDDRFQQATIVMGAVLVNHLASAVDAWLSTTFDIDDTALQFRPAVFGPRGPWSLSLHIGALP